MAFNRAYLTTSEFGGKGLLKGKKEISDAAREGVEAAAVAGTSTVLVAYLFG